MTTPHRNTAADYRDLAISEAVARILDLEHDYALTRLMLSEALTIAAKAKRDAAHEREQRLGLAREFQRFRARSIDPAFDVAALPRRSRPRGDTPQVPVRDWSPNGTGESESPRPTA